MMHGILKKENKMEKLSVIVPVYNVYPYLRECLDSIIKQSYKNLEIIIVNDASPYIEDDEICKEYASKDERIIYIKHEENKKQGGARNTGIKAATGKYITFVDSDDYLSDMKAYENCMKKIEEDSNINVVVFGATLDINGTTLYHCEGYQKYNTNVKFQGFIWQMIYKKSDLVENDIYFPENIYYEDGVFLLKYLFTIKPLIYGISTSYYFYRNYDGQTTKNVSKLKYMYDSYSMIMDFIEEKHIFEETNKLMIEYLKYPVEYRQYLYTIEDEIKWNEERKKIIKLIKRIKPSDEDLLQQKLLLVYGLMIPNRQISEAVKNFLEYITNYYEIKDNKCIVDTVNLNKFLKILNKHYKYKDAKGNIILYKIKREINRVIKQIKCLIIKKNKI